MDCKLVFIYPLPDNNEYKNNLEISYDKLACKHNKSKYDSFDKNEKFKIRNVWEKKRIEVFREDLSILNKHLKKSGKTEKISLLDVGCGEGLFILEAQKRILL